MSFRQLVRNLRKADEQKEREKIVVKRITELTEKLQNNEITGGEMVQALEELLYNVRMGKI